MQLVVRPSVDVAVFVPQHLGAGLRRHVVADADLAGDEASEQDVPAPVVAGNAQQLRVVLDYIYRDLGPVVIFWRRHGQPDKHSEGDNGRPYR